MPKHRMILVTLVIFLIITSIWLYPSSVPVSIDDSWWIVCNGQDSYDPKTAGFIETAYGGTIVDINAEEPTGPDAGATTKDFNILGQSCLFIGGSDEFGRQLPWADPNRPSLEVVKPDTHPEIYFDSDGTWDNNWIHTPSGNVDVVKDGVFLHDLGYIARGYDVKLRRWIVICVGWSAEATAAGANIIVSDLELVQSCSWLVYDYNGGTVSLNTWKVAAFTNYEIVGHS